MTDSSDTSDSPVPKLARRRVIGAGGVIVLSLLALSAIMLLRDTDSSTESTPPPIVYFAPSDAYAPNLILFDGKTTEPRTIIDLDDEIRDYAVSPDGAQIAFSRSNVDGTIDIWVIEIATGQMRPLTDCVKARCVAPAWGPDGTALAYQRNDLNPATDRTEPRVWIVDVQTAESRLLASDVQQHGSTPVWDPAGQRIAFYDRTVPGLRILDMMSGSEVVVENTHDAVGQFSPDGSRMVYPVLARGALGETFYTQLEIIDFDVMEIERLSATDEAPVEDVYAVWDPDSTHLLVARRYLDARYTSGTQLYRLDVETGEAEPLIVDPAYNHASMAYDATGRWIVFQRFPLAEAGADPEVWLYDTESGALRLIAENAFYPAFME